MVTYYLSERWQCEHAATATGDLSTVTAGSQRARAIRFTYDPDESGACRMEATFVAPAMPFSGRLRSISRRWKGRDDILVYSTTDRVRDRRRGERHRSHRSLLFVGSNAQAIPTVTVKLLDVYPDGRAYNLDETIQRACVIARAMTSPRCSWSRVMVYEVPSCSSTVDE